MVDVRKMCLRKIFSLLSLFTLCNAVTNRNGCDEITAVRGSPMVMMNCPPVAAPDPPERIGSITWQHNTTQTSIDLDPNLPRYRQDSSNTFAITDIVPEDEGVYSCIFQIEGGSSPRSMTEVSTCIIVPASAIFQACGMESCWTGPFTVREGENVTIDSRVGFVNGGACGVNRTITLMMLNMEGRDAEVFSCSNEGGFVNDDCISNARVQVTPQGPQKYDFELTVINVTAEDDGNYFLHVEFINDSGGRDRLYQNFTLSTSNDSSTPSIDTPTTAIANTTMSSEVSSMNRNVAIGVGVTVPLVILGLVLILLAAVLVITMRQHTHRHKERLTEKPHQILEPLERYEETKPEMRIHEQIVQEAKRSSAVLETTETYFTEVFEAEKCQYI